MKKKIDSFKAFETNKPSRKVIKEERLDYHDMMSYLEKKYNFQSRGFTGIPSTMNSKSYFDDWCDKHGLPKIDQDGKDRGSSQIFYKKYKEAEDGAKLEPPYMDFWHYLCDVNDDIRNGGYVSIPRVAEVKKIDSLKLYRDLLHTEKDPETRRNLMILIGREVNTPKVDKWEGWEQKITDLIFKEFGEYANDDYLSVWVEW